MQIPILINTEIIKEGEIIIINSLQMDIAGYGNSIEEAIISFQHAFNEFLIQKCK